MGAVKAISDYVQEMRTLHLEAQQLLLRPGQHAVREGNETMQIGSVLNAVQGLGDRLDNLKKMQFDIDWSPILCAIRELRPSCVGMIQTEDCSTRMHLGRLDAICTANLMRPSDKNGG